MDDAAEHELDVPGFGVVVLRIDYLVLVKLGAGGGSTAAAPSSSISTTIPQERVDGFGAA